MKAKLKCAHFNLRTAKTSIWCLFTYTHYCQVHIRKWTHSSPLFCCSAAAPLSSCPFVIPLSPCSNFTSVTRSFEPHTTLKEKLWARVLFHQRSGLWSKKMKCCWKIRKQARNCALYLGFKLWFWYNVYDEVNEQTFPGSVWDFGSVQIRLGDEDEKKLLIFNTEQSVEFNHQF